MRRGELYLVPRARSRDPKRQRVFVVVSRPALIDSHFPTVICAPVYSSRHGITTQVLIGPEEGLKHDSAIHCDELVSLPKSLLTRYVGLLSDEKMKALDRALVEALALDKVTWT